MTTIRQMCETYNVTPRTLRFYEQRGLLSPIRHGNRREFTEACKKRVELILRLKGFGFSLDDVEVVLWSKNGAQSKSGREQALRAIAVRTLGRLSSEFDRIDAEITSLTAALDPAQGMKAFELEGA